jgi:hypothetical protein
LGARWREMAGNGQMGILRVEVHRADALGSRFAATAGPPRVTVISLIRMDDNMEEPVVPGVRSVSLLRGVAWAAHFIAPSIRLC